MAFTRRPLRLTAFASLLISSTAGTLPVYGQGRGDYNSNLNLPAQRQPPAKVPLDMSVERQRWLFARACDSSVASWAGSGDWIGCTGFAHDGTPASKGHLFLSDSALVIGPGKRSKDGGSVGATCELDVTFTDAKGAKAELVCEFLSNDRAKQLVRVFVDGVEVGRFTPSAKLQRYELGPLLRWDAQRMAAIRTITVLLIDDKNEIPLLEAKLSANPTAYIDAMKREVRDQDALVALSSSGTPREADKRCLLTTSCCDIIGLGDDCFELTVLRRYRDRVLAKTASGAAEIELYYSLAPVLLQALRDKDYSRTLVRIYFTHIIPCVAFAILGLNHAVHRRYVHMIRYLWSCVAADSEPCSYSCLGAVAPPLRRASFGSLRTPNPGVDLWPSAEMFARQRDRF